MTTVRHGGAGLVLLLVSPTIHAYFLWQALVSIGYTIGLTWLLWHYMPGKGERAYFELASIQGIWRFAAGMSGIAVLVLVINQSDKIILSRMLPLGQFGLYVLAAMVAQSLLILANPYINAVFPRFTQLAAIGDRAGQSSLYHFTAQAITVSILVVGLIIVVYAREIVGLWTQNQATAELVAPVLRMLVAGNIFYISQATIFRLALAHGWTRLNIAQGTVVALVYIPTLVALTVRLGPLGAGWAWLALNVLTAPIFVFRAMKRLLPGEYLQWLGRDFLLPLLCATVPLVCVRPFVSPDTPQVVLLLAIAAVGFIAIIAASLAAPAVRAYVLAGVTYLAARAT
jgi:O-antigen/teichoic acid export membrane protein